MKNAKKKLLLKRIPSFWKKSNKKIKTFEKYHHLKTIKIFEKLKIQKKKIRKKSKFLIKSYYFQNIISKKKSQKVKIFEKNIKIFEKKS